MVVRVIVDVLELYIILLFVRIILTWFPVDPLTRAGKVVGLISRVTDPVLQPIRRMVPPLRFGGIGLDLSPIIVLVALEILVSVLGGGGLFARL